MKILKKFIILFFLISLFNLSAYSISRDNLTCFEIKTVMSNNFSSINVIDYFYIDSRNHNVYAENFEPVDEVSRFDDKWIIFKYVTSLNEKKYADKGYDEINEYQINRYTGSVIQNKYLKAKGLGTKIDALFVYGETVPCIRSGKGTAKQINMPKKQF